MTRRVFKTSAPQPYSPWQTPGTVYRLAGPAGPNGSSTPGLAVDTIVDPEIDTAKMTAAAIICTPAVDRQNEIIQPGGVDFADYTKNPVVLWEHGFNPNMPLPIARCETDDGKLDLRATPEAIEATSHFSTKSMESYQIFGLIVDRIVRATSIHIIPDETVERIVGNERVTVYPKSRMLEFSWGCIGVNPEAVARVLNTGRIGGDAICAAIAKTLRPFAPLPSRSKVRVGFDNGAGNGKAKTMTPEEEAAAKKAADDAAAAAAGANGGAGGGAGDPPVDDPAADDQSTPSVRVANAVRSSLSQLMSNLEAAGNTYEDPRAKEYFGTAFMEQCKAMLTEVDGLISELGGKAAKADEGGEDDEAAAEEAMKTFLAGGVRQRLQVLGFAAPLESIASAKNLTPEQKLTVNSVMKNIRQTVNQAKASAEAAKSKISEEQLAKLKTDGEARAKSLAKLTDSLKELLPANA